MENMNLGKAFSDRNPSLIFYRNQKNKNNVPAFRVIYGELGH